MALGTNSSASRNGLPALPNELSRRLLENARTTTLKKGQLLLQAGTVGDGCYWLNEGALKVSVASAEGAERILAILGRGSLVG